MATVTRTYLVDDLDGSEDDVSTVRFHLDMQFDTAHARKTVKAIPASRDQTQAIREWARGTGYVVSERGRIPKNVQEAFNQAH